jgi:isopentenyl-diphosphate delta-isomerase
MLLQKRASTKYHSAGLWTNACCSHPKPGDDVLYAAQKRLQEEMGFTTPLTKAFSFIYKAHFDNGLTEHEFDHVFIGYYNGKICPNADEVDEFNYLPLDTINHMVSRHPHHYTEWFKIALPKVEQYLQATS